jgi:hypothetical protein
MSRTIETVDITLLRTDKNEFVIRCQRIISIIVKKFIGKGMFIAADFKDITQTVNVELIRRLPAIEKNYTGEALLETYVSVIIKNICLRLYESETNGIKPTSISETWVVSNEHTDDAILISDEFTRFETAVALLHSQRLKALVCLKVYFSIPLNSSEVRKYFRSISVEDHYRLLSFFTKHYIASETNECFTVLSHMINKYEENLTTEESVRRWTNMMLQKLIGRMNGRSEQRAHTKESIKLLLERYSELHNNHD